MKVVMDLDRHMGETSDLFQHPMINSRYNLLILAA